MAEWSNAAVLKTVEGHTSGGSNPSLSADQKSLAKRGTFLFSVASEPQAQGRRKIKKDQQSALQTEDFSDLSHPLTGSPQPQQSEGKVTPVQSESGNESVLATLNRLGLHFLNQGYFFYRESGKPTFITCCYAIQERLL